MPYRKTLNFTFDGLKSAATAIDRLRNFKLRWKPTAIAEGAERRLTERTAPAAQAFPEAWMTI